jgi:asparagine synthase (glutamine-hydrolysing)
MTQNRAQFLAFGEPRFTDPELARCQREQGVQAAWAQALDRSGNSAMPAVAGEFAVARRLPDGRCFLAVDRFATHPLCYRVAADGLHFAARADELASGDDEIDPQAIFSYLYFHMIPSPRTVYRGVHRLPAGHCAVFEAGQLTVTPYAVPHFTPDDGTDFHTRRDTFRGLLRQAVSRHLDGSKPACFLSGGTDSSTVAGLITEVAGRPAATYSIGFDAAGYDEMAYARIAARHFGTDHHEYYVTPDDLVQGIPGVARHFDQPFGNSSALPAFCCARFARDDGVTRLLAGDGGDELFGGNTRYAKQRLFGWYGAVPAVVRHGLLEPLLLKSPAGRWPGLSKAASYVEQARVPMPDRNRMYNLLLRLGTAEVLTPAFLSRVNVDMPLKEQRAVWRSAQADNELDRELAYDWRFTLAENDLPKVCMTAQLAGASVRFPFLDDDVLAFSMRLPPQLKLKGQQLRWFFKEALRGFLPDDIITKKKHGFGLPFGVWALQHGGLRALSTDSLNSLAARGIVQPRFIRTLLDQRLREHPGYYGEKVWILMMLEQWLQAHAPGYRVSA